MGDAADIVIVGGGAAGLTAAIFAAEAARPSVPSPVGQACSLPPQRRDLRNDWSTAQQDCPAQSSVPSPLGEGQGRGSSASGTEPSKPSPRIVLLEGTRQCGTKILASGGGRCNVTHEAVGPEDFNGSRNIVRNILAAFDAATTVRWFASLGVELKREETGKLFPVTDSAHTVLNALLDRCRALGTQVWPNCRVTAIQPPSAPDQPFAITHAQGTLSAPRIILATGGRSLPKSGSDGIGWDIARQLGHTVTTTHQALTPLILDPGFFHAQLSGISLEVELSTFVEGKRIDCRRGNLLFTHFGVSGPAVMDASRHWVMAADQGKKTELRCNFMPGESFETVEKWLITVCTSRPKAAISTLLSERLPERVATALPSQAGVDPGTLSGQVSRDARRSTIHALTNLLLPVTQPRGWNYAEVTAGGIPLSEINFRTMESRRVPGLYLIGEILDCDGRIGGFNFQWAWSTGHIAGNASAK